MHNQYRTMYGMPALVWDATVAPSAQDWADNCVFDHSNNQYGENLGLFGGSDPSSVVTQWFSEGCKYTSPGFSETTGHFTQLIWKSTTKVGCAVGNCPAGIQGYRSSSSRPGASPNVFVCQYSTMGNNGSPATYQVNVPIPASGPIGC